jgi:Secretion system C-terminal sorting domain
MKKRYISIASLCLFMQSLTAQTLIKATNGAAITIQSGATIYAEGTVTLDNNTTLTNNGTLTVVSGGSVQNSGTYTGSGAVVSGAFSNSGTVAPTNCLSFGNGFTNSGVVAIDLGGTTACTLHDKLNVTGTATLGGTLTVTLANAYTGAANNTATIVDATALSGTFSTVNLPPSWFASYNNPSTGKMTLAFSSPLPVELLNFSGYTEGGQNFLVWTTANEINSKGFQVERLNLNTNAWESIGFVNSKGKAAIYDFTDKAPFSVSYYRLRQIDNDGKEILSKIVSLSNTAKSFLKVYPNPATDVLTVEFTKGIGTTEKAPTFEVINLLGQIILRGPLNQSVDVSSLPNGTYIVRVDLEQVKFVKQ